MQGKTEVESRSVGTTGILDISGEITSFSEEILDGSYERLNDSKYARIALNFEKVDYINSAGMAIIIGILTKTRKRDQTLVGWGLTQHFQKIFDMVGITKYMKHFTSEAEALKGD